MRREIVGQNVFFIPAVKGVGVKAYRSVARQPVFYMNEIRAAGKIYVPCFSAVAGIVLNNRTAADAEAGIGAKLQSARIAVGVYESAAIHLKRAGNHQRRAHAIKLAVAEAIDYLVINNAVRIQARLAADKYTAGSGDRTLAVPEERYTAVSDNEIVFVQIDRLAEQTKTDIALRRPVGYQIDVLSQKVITRLCRKRIRARPADEVDPVVAVDVGDGGMNRSRRLPRIDVFMIASLKVPFYGIFARLLRITDSRRPIPAVQTREDRAVSRNIADFRHRLCCGAGRNINAADRYIGGRGLGDGDRLPERTRQPIAVDRAQHCHRGVGAGVHRRAGQFIAGAVVIGNAANGNQTPVEEGRCLGRSLLYLYPG